MGIIKGLLSGHVYSKKESWKTALSLTEKGKKEVRQMKSTTDKKEELLTLLRVMMQIGDDKDDDDELGPVEPITSPRPCDRVLGY